MIVNYLVGFLNSDGGTLYLGIDNQSRVRGIEANSKDLDDF